jgi:G:T-mismatch repair DNA endonuclease (very short patch repair protein)
MKLLRLEHWKVITIFECQLKSAKRDDTLIKLLNHLK